MSKKVDKRHEDLGVGRLVLIDQSGELVCCVLLPTARVPVRGAGERRHGVGKVQAIGMQPQASTHTERIFIQRYTRHTRRN